MDNDGLMTGDYPKFEGMDDSPYDEKDDIIIGLRAQLAEKEAAFKVLIDMIDYENGACRVNEMIGSVLPAEVLQRARAALSPKEK